MARNKYKKQNIWVIYSCGHEGKVQVGGYTEEYRQEMAKELAQGLCRECQQAAYLRQGEEDAELNKERGFKPLEGTEKQINWAETIRKETGDWIVEMRKKLPEWKSTWQEDFKDDKEALEECSEMHDLATDFINTLSKYNSVVTDAGEIIDRRRDYSRFDFEYWNVVRGSKKVDELQFTLTCQKLKEKYNI